jgi:DNA-directed RNA polymerase subunit N (RpoN/RPB10)
MLYFKCPTCRTILSNRQIPYEKGLEKIINDKSLTETQKEEEKRKLVNSLGLKRYCCKMRLMTYTRKVKIIL